MEVSKHSDEKNILVLITIFVALFFLGLNCFRWVPSKVWANKGTWVFDLSGLESGLVAFAVVSILYPLLGILLSYILSGLKEGAFGEAWDTSTTIQVAAFWPLATIVLFPTYMIRIFVNVLCDVLDWLYEYDQKEKEKKKEKVAEKLDPVPEPVS